MFCIFYKIELKKKRLSFMKFDFCMYFMKNIIEIIFKYDIMKNFLIF